MGKVIYIQKNDIHCTLTTFFYCNFWQLYSVQKQGDKGYINWFRHNGFLQSYDDEKMYEKHSNAYSWYFKQPMFSENEIPARDETWTWEIDGDKMLGYHLMSQPLSVIKEFYKNNLHFNDETNRRGQLLVDKYGIDFSKTIGVTWRGTDIYLESQNGYEGRRYTPIEYYFEWIDKALQQIPDARVACTSEEDGILEPLLKRYPQAFLIDDFYQAPKGSKHNPERFSPMSGYERGIQPALMVWLFSKCAWLIKNRASTSAVASWCSDGEIVNICHNEVLGFPPHIEGVEYKEKLYPLNK